MGHVCARCLVDFPAREGGRRLIWCRVDGFYVCDRCWRTECGGGHGKAYEKSVGWGSAAPAVLALITAFLVGPIVIGLSAGRTSLIPRVFAIVASFSIMSWWALFFAAYFRRRRLHSYAVQGKPPTEINTTSNLADESIEWRPNLIQPLVPHWGRLFIAVGFGLGGTVFLLLVASSSDPISYLPVVLFFDIPVLIPLAVLTYFRLVPPITPSRIAITSDGAHFWYDSPYLRYVKESFVPWRAVTVVRFDSDTDEWVFVTAAGLNISFGILTPANLQALLRKWRSVRSGGQPGTTAGRA